MSSFLYRLTQARHCLPVCSGKSTALLPAGCWVRINYRPQLGEQPLARLGLLLGPCQQTDRRTFPAPCQAACGAHTHRAHSQGFPCSL